MKYFWMLIVLILFLAGCDGADAGETAVSTTPSQASNETGMDANMGQGMGPGMMARHMAPVPEEYAGLANPIDATEESLARGAEVYTTYCASCHGDGGMGDGPAVANLDPAPAPIAHTSRMLGDDYLYWRITEGGNMDPFNSVMPAWKAGLTPEQRWDVINYVRALGTDAMPEGMGMGMNGVRFDPEAEATRQAEMLQQAVAQGVITEAEAAVFETVHALIESQMTTGMQQMRGNMSQMQDVLLEQLIDTGALTAEDAAAFRDIHERLVTAGLMQ